jgi:hypothetical protein
LEWPLCGDSGYNVTTFAEHFSIARNLCAPFRYSPESSFLPARQKWEVEMSTPGSAAKVRLNYVAILVAAIACFLFEAFWYSTFLQLWLDGIGRSREWMMSAAAGLPPLQYGTAILSAAVMATAISCVTQLTGPQTALRGMQVGALLWLGFVLTVLSTAYVFEVRPLSLLGIDAGFWFFGCITMGAIVGAWKKRRSAASAPSTEESSPQALKPAKG